MKIQFIKTERDCPYNESIRTAGETKGLIYDYHIFIDGKFVGVWRKNTGSIGYTLWDSGLEQVCDPAKKSYMHYSQRIAVNKKDDFDAVTEKFMACLPTEEQIAQRQADKLKEENDKVAAEVERIRIWGIKEAAVNLYEAMKPFAALLKEHHEGKDDSHIVFGINDSLITVGDMRRAKAAIEKAEEK